MPIIIEKAKSTYFKKAKFKCVVKADFLCYSLKRWELSIDLFLICSSNQIKLFNLFKMCILLLVG